MKQEEQPIHSDVLLKAKAEIEAVLVKYNIAGVAVLHQQGEPRGYLENIVHLNPSYSLVYMDGPKLKSEKPPLASPTGQSEAEIEFRANVAATINMLFNLKMRLNQLTGAMNGAEVMARQNFNVPMPKPPGGKNGTGGIIKPFN